jgi:hypothetical protein
MTATLSCPIDVPRDRAVYGTVGTSSSIDSMIPGCMSKLHEFICGFIAEVCTNRMYPLLSEARPRGSAGKRAFDRFV